MRLKFVLVVEFVKFAVLFTETLQNNHSKSEDSVQDEIIREGHFEDAKHASANTIGGLLRKESPHSGVVLSSGSNFHTQMNNEATGHSEWPLSYTKALSEYISQGGGQLHPYLKVNDTYHGGATIRGVITTGPLRADTVILRIPRKLWVLEASLPLVLNKSLDRLESCQGQAHDLNLKDLTYGTALALEKRKGRASPFSTYLETMPSHVEMNRILPRLASREVLRDFQTLPLVQRVRRQQQADRNLGKCYQDLQKSEPRLAELPWEEVLTSLFGQTSRNFGIKDGEMDTNALIVFADLLNTGPGEEPNVIWEAPSPGQHPDEFVVKVKRDLMAGTELIDDYCGYCANNDMVDMWGIYFEGNPNQLKAEEARHVNCKDEGMRKAAMETLLTKGSHMTVSNLTAPRCAPHIWNLNHGGVRCSLARLAWEYCGCFWEGRVCPAGFAENRPAQVSCGGHFADSCSQCPSPNMKHPEAFCNGDCTWNEGCRPRPY